MMTEKEAWEKLEDGYIHGLYSGGICVLVFRLKRDGLISMDTFLSMDKKAMKEASISGYWPYMAERDDYKTRIEFCRKQVELL